MIKRSIGASLLWCLAACVSAEQTPEEQVLNTRAVIGWKLFFDTRLSRNNNVSCATCHDPDKGYGDGLAFSTGTHGDVLTRNSPSVINLANASHFFWDGRASSLEEQAEGPLTNPLEMDLTLEEAEQRVSADADYQKAFSQIGVEDITSTDITAALAAFQRKLVTGETAYDRWLQGDTEALTKAQSNGRFLFFTRGQCAICHIGADFSDHDFHNVGTGTLDDLGRYSISGAEEEKGFYKTPSLRNWRGKEPFMHDGRFTTMEEVIAFYTDPPAPEVGKSELDALRFSERDQADLLAFMEALNGEWPDLQPYEQAWDALVAAP
jgi:cytochrome c peroxidase